MRHIAEALPSANRFLIADTALGLKYSTRSPQLLQSLGAGRWVGDDIEVKPRFLEDELGAYLYVAEKSLPQLYLGLVVGISTDCQESSGGSEWNERINSLAADLRRHYCIVKYWISDSSKIFRKNFSILAIVGATTSATSHLVPYRTNRMPFFCYLIKSCAKPSSTACYIGFSTCPIRRLRQHNGEIVSAIPS